MTYVQSSPKERCVESERNLLVRRRLAVAFDVGQLLPDWRVDAACAPGTQVSLAVNSISLLLKVDVQSPHSELELDR